ncbi:SRPBCC family protein [Mycobacterium sp. 94-17]|uniref:SRPBCC family protein n=1 Tax=Mycobacterium sp. 94-17 TaxID=2986147 RepID=UPI003B6341F0
MHVERAIATSPDRVFNWLANPANFASPLASQFGFKAGYVERSDPHVGAVREVEGFGNTWFREEITAYDFPLSYSYRVIRAVPTIDHEGGTMSFSPSADGTRVDWSSWRVPVTESTRF